jgi:hypothetical protein
LAKLYAVEGLTVGAGNQCINLGVKFYLGQCLISSREGDALITSHAEDALHSFLTLAGWINHSNAHLQRPTV